MKNRLAWMGGFFEGEGCIHMAKMSHRRTPNLRIVVGNIHRKTLEVFSNSYGGVIQVKKLRPNRELSHLWICPFKSQRKFLRELKPYLLFVKKKQLELATQFLNSKTFPGSGRGLTNLMLKKRERFYIRINKLNGGGKR